MRSRNCHPASASSVAKRSTETPTASLITSPHAQTLPIVAPTQGLVQETNETSARRDSKVKPWLSEPASSSLDDARQSRRQGLCCESAAGPRRDPPSVS